MEEERMRKGKNPEKAGVRDMLETEVDFMELQELLNQLIIDHDPEEAKKLGLLTGY